MFTKMEIKNFAQNYINNLQNCIAAIDWNDLEKVTEQILNAYQNNKKIFLIGNGGSAATASHMMCDFNKGIIQKNDISDEKRFRTICLSDNIPLITAWSNDSNYENIFLEQIKNLYEEGDVLLAISASGNSKNVILACEYVKKRSGTVIGFAGFSGGRLSEIADACITAKIANYEIAEDIHSILMHILKSFFIETLKKSN